MDDNRKSVQIVEVDVSDIKYTVVYKAQKGLELEKALLVAAYQYSLSCGESDYNIIEDIQRHLSSYEHLDNNMLLINLPREFLELAGIEILRIVQSDSIRHYPQGFKKAFANTDDILAQESVEIALACEKGFMFHGITSNDLDWISTRDYVRWAKEHLIKYPGTPVQEFVQNKVARTVQMALIETI